MKVNRELVKYSDVLYFVLVGYICKFFVLILKLVIKNRY
jgi:hypothetical protein